MCLECWDYYGLSSLGECVQCNATYAGWQGPVPICRLCDGDDPAFCYDCGSYQNYVKYTFTQGSYATQNYVKYTFTQGSCHGRGGCPDSGLYSRCIECANLNGTCTTCNDRHVPIDGVCQACSDLVPGCAECQLGEDGRTPVCTACTFGYWFDGTTGTCTQMCRPGPCFCIYCDRQGFRLSCSSDFAPGETCSYALAGVGPIELGSCQEFAPGASGAIIEQQCRCGEHFQAGTTYNGTLRHARREPPSSKAEADCG
ncbi:hypothetical protein ABPG75_003538 [Micractinium tetrahymenae]